jgi:hypothetical protein
VSSSAAYDRRIERAAVAWTCATVGLLAGGLAGASYCGSSGFVYALIVLAFVAGTGGVAFGVFWSLPGRPVLRALAAFGLSGFVTIVVFVIAGLANISTCGF